jgi:hypothetical protein
VEASCPLQATAEHEETGDADRSGGELQLICGPSVVMNRLSSSAPGSSELQALTNPTADSHFIVMHSMTVWTAFNHIATMLDLSCTHGSGFSIRALPHTLPPTMIPTSTQQLVPHQPYVDMLPWPSLRDRVLKSLAAINEIELIMDMESLKIWGSTPWDSMGWEVPPEFAKKWWFLIDDGIIRTTNFWRAQRGEEALVLAVP